ncbi:MAG: hypothetical protein HY791_34775 [Deltaproteobacteria bacterium]|nr:hypothetical protein [Deltaproteobacteria bacterium]
MSEALQVETPRPVPARAGWRGHRPIEDPEKTKRWGFVSARPSEYLVHVRHGKVRMRSSGQGASCFKFPWDGVAIVPTSLQNVKFRADQVTLERVGVEVSGFAVYRIADPMMASRVLNFSYPERAQQKLEQTLTEMLVGATRRLVANLSVDRCLGERKSALADELLREIAPVVGGAGRVDDMTDQGWGVVIDTIEVQEVRVRSESVFSTLQAPFRAEIEERARRAKAEAESSVASAEAELNRRSEEARIAAEATVRERRAAAARAVREEAAKDALRAIALENERAAAEHRAKRTLEEERLMLELETLQKQLECEAAEAKARADAQARKQAIWKQQVELTLSLAELTSAERALEASLAEDRVTHESKLQAIAIENRAKSGRIEAELRTLAAEALLLESDARARLIATEKLPELAAAIGKKVESVQVTQIGVGDPLTSMLRSLLELVGARVLGRPPIAGDSQRLAG